MFQLNLKMNERKTLFRIVSDLPVVDAELRTACAQSKTKVDTIAVLALHYLLSFLIAGMDRIIES